MIRETLDGSGIVAPSTFTVASAVLESINEIPVLIRYTFDKFTEVVPAVKAEKLILASVPLPVTPGPGPSRVFAVKLMVPATSLIDPATKLVLPSLDRNEPSLTDTADNTLGVKAMSNWNANRSVTSVTFTFSEKELPGATVTVAGWRLTMGEAKTAGGTADNNDSNTTNPNVDALVTLIVTLP